MAITPTYPGVYIQEIPSGVRTITGVATSIAAFVGSAARGPVNEPITINSYGDFERVFGGLWMGRNPTDGSVIGGTLGYAVRDFYLNGGGQAIIVRLVNGGSKATLSHGSLILEAASEGAWGNSLLGTVEYPASDDMTEQIAERYGVPANQLFNLIVEDEKTSVTERFNNVTVVDGPRRVDQVLANESTLVRAVGQFPLTTRPNPEVTNESLINGSDGVALMSTELPGDPEEKTGIYALEKVDLFNLLCIPPLNFGDGGDISTDLIAKAVAYCEERRAMLIIDPPVGWTSKDLAKTGIKDITTSKNAAIFFPRLRQPNPLRDNQLEDFAPCGAVAGVFARTDARRGIWKAPAGLDATLNGVPQLSVSLTDAENGELNPLGVNCLRTLPAAGRVVWGSRTRQGDDRLASEWKYIPVRRLALYIEESLYRGTQWVVFEPNDEPLWAQIRLNVGAFMHNLFRQGAFQGRSPKEAYFVKCDRETTTQNDVNLGRVNIVVGFAPLKPAEFVMISLQQMAGEV